MILLSFDGLLPVYVSAKELWGEVVSGHYTVVLPGKASAMAMRSMLQISTYTRGSWCNNMELFASRRSGYDPLTLPTSSPGGACRHPWRIVQGPCPPLPSDGTVEPLSNTSQFECPSSATVRWQPSIHTCGSLLLTPPMMVTIGSKHNGSCDRPL